MNRLIEYKVILFVTALLFSLAWSWLPWLVYNGIALIVGMLPPVGIIGYYTITVMLWGASAAVIEHKNPRNSDYEWKEL